MLFISLKSYDLNLLNQFCEKIININKRLSSSIKGPIFLPKKSKLYTVIRSSHVYSLSREQFEVYTYRRVFVLQKDFNFIKTFTKLSSFYRFYKKFLKTIPVGVSVKLSFKI